MARETISVDVAAERVIALLDDYRAAVCAHLGASLDYQTRRIGPLRMTQADQAFKAATMAATEAIGALMNTEISGYPATPPTTTDGSL